MGREYRCVKSVLLTRSEEDTKRDRELFERIGFKVLSLPLIRTVPLNFDPPQERFDMVIFQSPKAVNYYISKASLPTGARIVAVGEKTRKTLEKRGVHVDFVPQNNTAEGIVEELPDGEGRLVLVPRSEQGRTEVIEGLRRKGYRVVPLNVYRTGCRTHPPQKVEEALRRSGFIVFASPSAVRCLFANLQRDRVLCASEGVVVVAIGKTTKRELENLGLPPIITPAKPLMEEVAGKIHEFWQKNCIE